MPWRKGMPKSDEGPVNGPITPTCTALSCACAHGAATSTTAPSAAAIHVPVRFIAWPSVTRQPAYPPQPP